MIVNPLYTPFISAIAGKFKKQWALFHFCSFPDQS